MAAVNIFGNIVHNLIDGMLIGASYLANIPLGIATTVAILLHEIPQEMGNFAVLIHSGYRMKKAIAINFLSALVAFLGVALALVVGKYAANFTLFLVPVTAGGFLYIAGSDLIPELKHETKITASIGQLAAIVLGIAVMAGLLLID
jgi:zinc and cadmium transporter